MFRKRPMSRAMRKRLAAKRFWKYASKGYVNILDQTLANAALTDTHTIIAAASDPATTQEATGSTTSIEVENDSMVKGKLTIEMAHRAAVSAPSYIDIILYKDAAGVTDVTDADAWAVHSDTAAIRDIKKMKMWFKRVFLPATTVEKVRFTIPIKPKLLKEGHSIKLFLESRNAGTHSIDYQVYGWTRARQV